jgi:hypothetical protein
MRKHVTPGEVSPHAGLQPCNREALGACFAARVARVVTVPRRGRAAEIRAVADAIDTQFGEGPG